MKTPPPARFPPALAGTLILLLLLFTPSLLPATPQPAPPSPQPTTIQPANLRLAIEDLIRTFGPAYPGGPAHLQRLGQLEIALAGGTPQATLQPALQTLARLALLENPLLDFDRILVLHRIPRANPRQAEGGNLGVGTSNWSTSDTLPRHGEFRDTLALLADFRTRPRLIPLFQPDNGDTLIDPVLHFDANRLLFARNGQRQNNWRLWELRLGDSTPAQISPDHGEDVAHFDACYLPDDRIILASTASYQGLPCLFGSDAMTCLFLFDPSSGSMRQLTFEQDSNWSPTLLPNGRVLYQRWEYTDQSHANSRLLFHMNPDGTDQREFRGRGSWFPGSFFYAKPVPGSVTQVVGIAGGHHDVPRAGRLLLLDVSVGRRDALGVLHEFPRRGQPVDPVVRDALIRETFPFPQFLMPAPLHPRYHLVAAKPRPDALWGLYLVDAFDNLVLIHEEEGAALLWPSPFKPQPRPQVLEDRINPHTDQATAFVADVHAGTGLDGVPRGTVHHLRVVEYYFSRRGVGGLYGSLGADGPWDIKRILGTVPVHPDGSAWFTLPANTPVCLQPLDADGQALQLERSWFVAMPGERVSCIGCHEDSQSVALSRPTLALLHPPAPIQPWFGPPRGFAFEREVQPVLDRHCVSCHDGRPAPNPLAPGQEFPDLRGGRPLSDWSSQMPGHWPGGGQFSTSYWELHRFLRRPGIEGDRRMFTPLDYHFSTTELGQLLRKGHHGVHLEPEARQRLAAWHDLNAPFFGTWGEIPEFTTGYGPLRHDQIAAANRRALELRRQFVPMGPFPDYEHIPDTPPYPAQPVPPNPAPPSPPCDPAPEGWPFPPDTALARQHEHLTRSRTLSLAPDVTLELVRIPGGRFLMGSPDGHPDERPRAAVAVRPFWMARFETSNRQFRTFHPSHESRTEDRHGYQFGITGHDQDHPDQPAVRVSWNDALAFTQWLSHRTGLPLHLPTEAQWEWAARAGSDQPFWFGPLHADFSPHANLGDAMLAQFAGDPYVQDRAKAAFLNPNRYDNWIPQDARFNDGGFVTEPVGRYLPNPWGLHDLHGNAAEWTRSAYRPYPYRDDDGRNAPDAPPHTERVTRGGSWRDRPFRATAAARLPYPQFQRVFNVGFRIVAEDTPETALR
ncbi:MAG: SUMF1/EgtB/PvdO family nonheme iron enzyme [Verrucomicrobiae bacterium]|nr:SUMF1/EgtB/PvdO family nonheme iron enzyme [Verrucomicrobiae bacterium]